MPPPLEEAATSAPAFLPPQPPISMESLQELPPEEVLRQLKWLGGEGNGGEEGRPEEAVARLYTRICHRLEGGGGGRPEGGDRWWRGRGRGGVEQR